MQQPRLFAFGIATQMDVSNDAANTLKGMYDNEQQVWVAEEGVSACVNQTLYCACTNYCSQSDCDFRCGS